MLMVLARRPLIMLRLCLQFKVCCGAFRVESCRENTVWFPWSALSHLCTEKKGSGKHPFQIVGVFSGHTLVFPLCAQKKLSPSSCGASNSDMYATWNSLCKTVVCARDVPSCFKNLQDFLSHYYPFWHTPWHLPLLGICQEQQRPRAPVRVGCETVGLLSKDQWINHLEHSLCY